MLPLYMSFCPKKGGQSPKQSIRKKNSGKKIREKWDPPYMVGKIPVQYNGLFIVTEHMNLVNILFYWGIVLYKVFLITPCKAFLFTYPPLKKKTILKVTSGLIPHE